VNHVYAGYEIPHQFSKLTNKKIVPYLSIGSIPGANAVVIDNPKEKNTRRARSFMEKVGQMGPFIESYRPLLF
jgi:hypothetical protein